MGYHLVRSGVRNFLILDANARVGDSWRQRWDSLRLFTPARYDGLDGMPFPAPPRYFPTKDEMADYLEAYARHFLLPVRNGVRVDGLSRLGDRYLVTAGKQRFLARQVVVAMASYQRPKTPPFAAELEAGIVQLHSSAYRSPAQLQAGQGAHRRRRQLGRGDRGRAPQGGSCGGDVRPRRGQRAFVVPEPAVTAAGRAAALPGHLPPAAHRVDACGTQGEGEPAREGNTAHPDAAPAPGRGRGGAGRAECAAWSTVGRCSRTARCST